jgi:hypothetical protein
MGNRHLPGGAIKPRGWSKKATPQRRKVHKRKPVPPPPTTALTVSKPPEKPWLLTQDEVTLIKNSVAKGASDEELKFCLTVARRYKLDPFKKQIWFVKRWDSGADNGAGGKGAHVYTPQVGIDGLLFTANRDHMKEFGSISLPEYGPMIKYQGIDAPEWAKVKVYKRGLSEPTEAMAWWTEYAPADLTKAPFWKKMPRRMIGKCATALGIRQAYPDLGGLYIPEEMEKMAEGFTESGRQIVEGVPLGGSREAAQEAGRRVYEEKKRQIEERAKEISAQPSSGSAPENGRGADAVTGVQRHASPKKIISISMPSDASDVAHVWGDLDAPIIEHIKGPCLGIKLEDKDVYVMPISHVVVLESFSEEKGYGYQEISGMPPSPSESTPKETAQMPESAARPSTNPVGASLDKGAPAAVSGKVTDVQPVRTSPKSKKQFRVVVVGKDAFYVYRTTMWPYLDECKGRECEFSIKDKVLTGFKRVGNRTFDPDGVTPEIQNNEPRPKAGRLFV